MRFILIIFLFPVLLFAQEKTLQQCLDMAVANHPLSPKINAIGKYHDLQKTNLESNWYPQIVYNAQITYQEPVVNVDINTEGIPFTIDFPTAPNDQYKTWIEVKQNIYDGGLIKQSKRLEEQSKKTEILQEEVNIEKVKQKVIGLYFTTLVMVKQEEQLELTTEELNEKLKLTRSLVDKGVLLQSALNGLIAEILKLEQQLVSVKSNIDNTYNTLKLYMGIDLNDSLKVVLPEMVFSVEDEINRKEYLLFDANKEKIDISQEFIKTGQRPKMFGFSQIGYGNPGLNMLNDSFEPYYIVGLGVSWNIYDWGRTKRDINKQVILKSNIDLQKDHFDMELEAALEKVRTDISTYEKILASDMKVIDAYDEVSNVASTQFDNGTINTGDYIAEIHKKAMAKLAYEIHKIQYAQAIANYYLITGKI